MKQLLKLHILLVIVLAAASVARVALAGQSDADARAALNALYKTSPGARSLAANAKGILVFPEIRKAAFVVGGQGGKGVMFAGGKIVGRYRADGALVGFEAGVQSFKYVLFFMSDTALQKLRESKGFELGTDPNIVVTNVGAGANISTTTAQPDVYSFVFGQRGLMGGIAVQGMKITRVR
jgi:lipid-binding SYLF domain-containing protein